MSVPLAAPPPVSFAPFGLALGHATDAEGGTGCTVIRGVERGFRAAVAVAGRATGTRELLAASPTHLVDAVDAVLLTGGSAYGLDAAAGVMRWMEERGRGFPVGDGLVVPIVPAAVIFDLLPLGRPDRRPTPAMAYEACDAARPDGITEGSVGAGTGATVGKALGAAGAMKGGVGCAAVAGAARAAAVAVVNAFGDVRDARGAIVAGARLPGGEWADTLALLGAGARAGRFADAAGRNTTIALVAVDAPLDRAVLGQLARAAAVALPRRITPSGTAFDGDVVFAACPAEPPRPLAPGDRVALEVLATQALEEAIERAVRRSRGRDGIPGLADAE